MALLTPAPLSRRPVCSPSVFSSAGLASKASQPYLLWTDNFSVAESGKQALRIRAQRSGMFHSPPLAEPVPSCLPQERPEQKKQLECLHSVR